MRARYIKTTVVLLSGFLGMGTSLADTYKWLSADGVMVYSQTMPSGGQLVETLKTVKPLEPLPPADEETTVLEEFERQIGERKTRMTENCEVARYNKAVLQTPAIVVTPDEEGNDVLLSDRQKEDRLAEAIVQIDTYCG